MTFVVRALAVIALVVSTAWFWNQRGYEPAVGVVGSLSTLIVTFVPQKRSSKDDQQKQVIARSSIGLQSGRDLNVGNINLNEKSDRDAE